MKQKAWLCFFSLFTLIGTSLAMTSGCVLDVWLHEPDMPECLKQKRNEKRC